MHDSLFTKDVQDDNPEISPSSSFSSSNVETEVILSHWYMYACCKLLVSVRFTFPMNETCIVH